MISFYCKSLKETFNKYLQTNVGQFAASCIGKKSWTTVDSYTTKLSFSNFCIYENCSNRIFFVTLTNEAPSNDFFGTLLSRTQACELASLLCSNHHHVVGAYVPSNLRWYLPNSSATASYHRTHIVISGLELG